MTLPTAFIISPVIIHIPDNSINPVAKTDVATGTKPEIIKE